MSPSRLQRRVEADPILIEEGEGKLIIFFSGLGQRLGFATEPFEFVKSTRYAQYTKMFVRDANKVWYQQGLKGITENITDTIAHLKELTESYENVICVGNSGGGFGALLFGAELQVTAVHAFAPQTFIDPTRDARFRAARRAVKLKDTILDVKPHLRGRTQYFIHYCGKDVLDNMHAEHLRDVPNVHLFKHKCNHHAIAKRLRKARRLVNLLECETAEEVCEVLTQGACNQTSSTSPQPPPQ